MGAEKQLDLFKALCGCHEIPREDFYESNPRIQPAGVVAVASTLLRSLGDTVDRNLVEPTAEHAVVLLRRVVRLVIAKGWHREALGLANHTQISPESWREETRIGCERVPLERVALTVAAFGVYTPPMILWSRHPSLEWLRVDTCLTVRCLWNIAGAA